MNSRAVGVGLTLLNLVSVLAVMSYLAIGGAQGEPSVLRGRSLELIDERGELRAQLSVEPEGEVVLRFRDQSGAIRVKLGAGKDGSGLVLLNDATEVGVHLLAKADGSSVKLVNKDAREKVIAP